MQAGECARSRRRGAGQVGCADAPVSTKFDLDFQEIRQIYTHIDRARILHTQTSTVLSFLHILTRFRSQFANAETYCQRFKCRLLESCAVAGLVFVDNEQLRPKRQLLTFWPQLFIQPMT